MKHLSSLVVNSRKRLGLQQHPENTIALAVVAEDDVAPDAKPEVASLSKSPDDGDSSPDAVEKVPVDATEHEFFKGMAESGNLQLPRDDEGATLKKKAGDESTYATEGEFSEDEMLDDDNSPGGTESYCCCCPCWKRKVGKEGGASTEKQDTAKVVNSVAADESAKEDKTKLAEKNDTKELGESCTSEEDDLRAAAIGTRWQRERGSPLSAIVLQPREHFGLKSAYVASPEAFRKLHASRNHFSDNELTFEAPARRPRGTSPRFSAMGSITTIPVGSTEMSDDTTAEDTEYYVEDRDQMMKIDEETRHDLPPPANHMMKILSDYDVQDNNRESRESPLVRNSNDSALFKPSSLNTGVVSHGKTTIAVNLTMREAMGLLADIERSAEEAEFLISDFGEEYVSTFFHMGVKQMVIKTKEEQYEWLVGKHEIPKLLNEKTPLSHLITCKPREVIVFSELVLKKLSLANKMVSDDFEAEEGMKGLDLNARFADAHYALEEVLSTLRKAKLKLHIVEKASRISTVENFVPKSVKDPQDVSDRLRRDWIIYRDSVNVLQFIRDVFEYFQKNPEVLKRSLLESSRK